MKTKSYFRFLFKQHSAYAVLTTLISFGLPAIELFICYTSIKESYPGVSEPTPMASALYSAFYYPLLLVLFSLLMPLVIFAFLYHKPDMDTYFGLPIKRRSLFLKQFLFGLTIVLAPLLLSYLLRAGLMNALFGKSITGPIEIRYILYTVVIMIGSALLLFSLTTLAILCTTTPFNGFIYSAAILAFFPILENMVQHLYSLRIGFLNDVGSRFSMINFPKLIITTLYAGATNAEKIWLIPWFLLIIPLFFLLLHLFKNRHVERIRGIFMVPLFCPIVINTLFLLILSSSISQVMANSTTWHLINVVLTLVILLIIYWVIHIALYHGRPPFFKTIGSYLLITAAALGISWFSNGPLHDAQSRMLPDASKVARIEIINPVIIHSPFLEAVTGHNSADVQSFLSASESDRMRSYSHLEFQRFLAEGYYDLPIQETPLEEKHFYFSKYYRRATITDAQKIQAALDFQKHMVERRLSGSASLDTPDTNYYTAPDGKHYFHNGATLIIRYFDKDDKLLDGRELPIYNDRMLSTARMLMDGKLYTHDGTIWR